MTREHAKAERAALQRVIARMSVNFAATVRASFMAASDDDTKSGATLLNMARQIVRQEQLAAALLVLTEEAEHLDRMLGAPERGERVE